MEMHQGERGRNVVRIAGFPGMFSARQSDPGGGRRHLRQTFFHEEGFLSKWKKKYCRRFVDLLFPPPQREGAYAPLLLPNTTGADGTLLCVCGFLNVETHFKSRFCHTMSTLITVMGFCCILPVFFSPK